MSLKLAKTVVAFLAERAEDKFTARQIAQWVFEDFPAECEDKKARSTSIKTDADLVQQLVAEIGSQRRRVQKQHPQVKTTEGRPRRYYWTAKSDQAEVTEAEKLGTDIQLRPGIGSLKEVDLYPLLSKYLWSELDIYSKRIDERRSSNKQGPKGNKWPYPDLVGMEDLTADWHQEIKGIVSEYADKKTQAMVIRGQDYPEPLERSGSLFPSGLQLLMGQFRIPRGGAGRGYRDDEGTPHALFVARYRTNSDSLGEPGGKPNANSGAREACSGLEYLQPPHARERRFSAVREAGATISSDG